MLNPTPELRPAELHVSVSQIKTFIMCPKKYKFRYVLGVEPERGSLNLVFGKSIHEALAGYYRVIQEGASPTEEALIENFANDFDLELEDSPPIEFAEGQDAGTIKDLGIGMLKVFFKEAEIPDEVLAVEERFFTDLTDPKTGDVIEEQLVGYLDGLVVFGGERVILEHKTAARRWSQDQLDYDLQVSTYLSAIRADKVRLQCLLKTKTPAFQSYDLVRSESQKQEAVHVICRVLEAVRAGAFWRNRGWGCRGCEYAGRCG